LEVRNVNASTEPYEDVILEILKKFNRRVSHEEFMADPEIAEIYALSSTMFDKAMQILVLRGHVGGLSVNGHITYIANK
jgi:glucokinase